MRKQLYLKFWLLAMLFSIAGASPAWGDDVYEKVTSTSGLVAGGKYLIVYENGTSSMAMGAEAGTGTNTYRKGEQVTVADSKVTISSQAVVVYTLGGTTDSYTLLGSDSKYLAKNTTSTKSNNYLNSSETSTDNKTKWKITYSGTQVTINSVNASSFNIKWNSSSPRFSCYTTAQTAIHLYKKADIAVSSVSVSPTSASVGVGGTVDLTATISPDNATNKNVTWSSSNTGVATVSASGVVTGVAAGEVAITATSQADGTKSASCTVTVTDAVPVTGVTLDKSSASLEVGGTVTLIPTIAPAEATNKNVTWESSNTSIATVEDGVVTAVAVGGPVNITVKSVADPTKTASCAVTVNPTAVTGVTLNKTATTIKVSKTETLTATVSPSNATNKAVTWSSSNTAVATVSNGIVTAVAAGNATITVTTTDGSKTATCVVTVVTAGDGSLAKPYDVDEALEIIEGLDDNTNSSEYYTRGIISRIKSTSVSSGKLSYYISIDGEESNEIQVYLGKNVGNTNFTATSNLTVGDMVVIYGSLYKYVKNSTATPEINTGNYIYLLNGQKYNVITFAASPVAGGEVEVKDAEDDAVSSGDEYYGGSVFNIQATANTGYSFSSWTSDKGVFDNAANATTTFTLPDAEDAAITANFTLNTHDLVVGGDHGSFTTTVNGEAWDGSSAITYGSTVSITAVADEDYAFSVWSTDDLDSYSTTTNPLVFTMPDNDVLIGATFIDANIEYDVNISQNTGGTISPDKAKAKAGETVTLSYVLDDNYVFNAWTVLDGSANEVTVTDNKFTMPASNVTVNASFIRQYTITYHVAGEEQTVKRTAGEVLGLDDPEAIDGMPFAGWSVTNDLSNPSFADNSAPVTSDMTLYATFTAHAAVNKYQKVTATSEVTDGDYLIVYEKDIIIFDGSLSALDAGSNIQKVTISNETIASNETVDSYRFTITAANGYIKSASGKYIGRSSGSNGMDTDDSGLSNTITINNGNAIIQGSGGYQLRFNSSTGSGNYRFRYYSSSSQQPIQLYKKVSTPAIYTFGETVSVSVTSAGYATYCSDKALDFSHATGLKVYIVTSDGSTTDYTEVTDAPANTGLLLKAAANDYEAYVVGTSTTDVTDNKLVGVTSDTGIYATTDGKTNFVLFNGTQGVGFYKVKSYNDGNPDFTVKANSAYLSVALVSNARESSFFGLPEDESETTGITMVQGERATTQGYYNLNGQRVSQPNRGLYIVNGKKIVIK